MSPFKRFVKFLLIFSLLSSGFLLFAVLLGFIFEKKLHRIALNELERISGSNINFSDSKVSFLRHWPDVTVNLTDLGLNPPGAKKGEDFIHASSMHVRLNFFSLFRDKYEINGLFLFDPELILNRNRDGKWNYEGIFEPQKTKDSKGAEVSFQLSKVRIRNGKIHYSDEVSNVKAEFSGFSSDLSSEWKGLKSDWDGIVFAQLDKLEGPGGNWFRDKKIRTTLKGEMDFTDGEVYEIHQLDGKFESLGIQTKGKASRKSNDRDYLLDFTFTSAKSSFKEFLSLFPSSWFETGKELKYAGDFKLNGWIKGLLGEKNAPDSYAGFEVENASVQYEGFEGKISGINLKGGFLNKPSFPALSHVSVNEARGFFGGKEIRGKFKYSEFDDPRLDFELEGELSLPELKKFHPRFAKATELRGKIFADIMASGKVRDFKNENYEAILAHGKVRLENITVRDNRLQKMVHNLNGNIDLDNSSITVNALSGKIGESDFAVNGKINSYIPWLLTNDAVLKADMKANASQFFLADFLPAAENATNQNTASDFILPERMNLAISIAVKNIFVADFEAKNLMGSVNIKEKRIDIDQLSFDSFTGKNSIKGSLLLLDAKTAQTTILIECKGLNMNQVLKTFSQWGDLSLMEDHLYGDFSGQVRLDAKLKNDFSIDLPSLKASGNYDILKGQILDYKPMEKLSVFMKMEKLKNVQFEDIHGAFSIQNQTFFVPLMKLKANEYQMQVEGKHGFDQTLDYYLKITMPKILARKSQSSQVQNLVQEAQAAEQADIILPIRVTGTSDNPKFTLDGNFVRAAVVKGVKAEKEEFKEAARKETEMIFGKQDTSGVKDWIIEEKREKKNPDGLKNFKNKVKGVLKPKD